MEYEEWNAPPHERDRGPDDSTDTRLLGAPQWIERRGHIVVEICDGRRHSIFEGVTCGPKCLEVMEGVLESAAPGLNPERVMELFVHRMLALYPGVFIFRFLTHYDLEGADFGWGVWTYDLGKGSWTTTLPELRGQEIVRGLTGMLVRRRGRDTRPPGPGSSPRMKPAPQSACRLHRQVRYGPGGGPSSGALGLQEDKVSTKEQIPQQSQSIIDAGPACVSDNRWLTRAFAEAGRQHKYNSVQAEFAQFRDFKVRWCRSYSWAEFEVTDYLRGAPYEVLVSVANTIFEKIDGNEVGYREDVCAWLTSPAFVDDHQGTYVRRFPGLGETAAGDHKDLNDSLERLAEAGLIERDPKTFVGWVRPSRGKSVGHGSVLMRVAAISGALDREEVSDTLLDYCVYSVLAHIRMGFDPTGGRRADEYEALLDLFPDRASAEEELEALGMRLRGAGHDLRRKPARKGGVGVGGDRPREVTTCAAGGRDGLRHTVPANASNHFQTA